MSEGRRGGREARRAVRTSVAVRSLPALKRRLPLYEVLSEEQLDRLHGTAMRVLEEIGIDFREDEALASLAPRPAPRSTASASASRAICSWASSRRPPSASRSMPATRPSRSRSAATRMVFGPTYGSPFVRGFDGERRYGTIEDLNNFHKLAYMAPALQNTGAVICEPVDVADPQAPPAHHRLRHPPQRQELHGPGHPPVTAPKTRSACARSCSARSSSTTTPSWWAWSTATRPWSGTPP